MMSLPRRILVISASACAACTLPSASPAEPAPQPACDSVVAEHRAHPTAAADQEPFVTEMRIPPDAPREVRGKTYTVRFVVTERGTVDPSSIVIPLAFPPRYAADVRRSVTAWKFEPARVGECRVPARFANRLTP